MTLDEAMARVARELDIIIESRLQALEARIRADCAATGPEDEDALDRPPDLDSPWQRITVEEIIVRERAHLDLWRGEALAEVRAWLIREEYHPR
jgi:hypothetical protein